MVVDKEDKKQEDFIGYRFIKRSTEEGVKCEIWQDTNNTKDPANSWKLIKSYTQKPNPMDKYFTRRKTCKHDKGLMYGHCDTFGGITQFDIVCDYCHEILYRTGGYLPVDKDPRLKQFTEIPHDEHKYAAIADLMVKIDKKLEEEKLEKQKEDKKDND